MESYLALRSRLGPASLLGTATVIENGNQKWYADFAIPRSGDIILGIFLTADQNRLERTELYHNADLLAVNTDPIALSNERIFTEENISSIKLQFSSIKVRVVYNKPGVEHAKLSVLTELLPNEIRMNINHNEGKLTIPSARSPTGKEISLSYNEGSLTGYQFPDKIEYYPVSKRDSNGRETFMVPHGPYILSEIIPSGRQSVWISMDLGSVHDYTLESYQREDGSRVYFIPQRDNSPLRFKMYKCCFQTVKIHVGGIIEDTDLTLKLILERVSPQEIADDIQKPEYVELKGGQTAVYDNGTFQLHKLEPEN